ncbi:MAG: class I SAM-dependent methyltransferase [Negativicutes bacterium]|jgi:SAM-dependent methyltransferase
MARRNLQWLGENVIIGWKKKLFILNKRRQILKYRESGMPAECMWNTFFNPAEILDKMGIDATLDTIIDVGCGYGTFLFPIAELVNSRVIGIDIDEEMIRICRDKSLGSDSEKIELLYGDISTAETLEILAKYHNQVDYITLFNILHCEEPAELLKNSFDILGDKGKIGVIHWKYEDTPRGPSMEIRPKPEMIIEWAHKAGFVLDRQIDLPPYHYGLLFSKSLPRR